MPLSEEPIIDIIKGITLIATTLATYRQYGYIWGKCFNANCPTCRGAGTVTCPNCHGRKLATARTMTPEAMEKLKLPGYVAPASAYELCNHCGPPATYDTALDLVVEPDEEDAVELANNVKLALSSKPVRDKWGPWAGTVYCPDCEGTATMKLPMYNVDELFKIGPWHRQIGEKVASRWKNPNAMGLEQRRAEVIDRERKGESPKPESQLYLEYESNPVTAAEVVPESVVRDRQAERENQPIRGGNYLDLKFGKIPTYGEDEVEGHYDWEKYRKQYDLLTNLTPEERRRAASARDMYN